MSTHTPGPWEVDSIDNDGDYGNGGPDQRSGFKSWVVIDANGRALFDTLNRDSFVTEVHEEYDDDGFSAWDELGRRDIELAAAAPLLLASLRAYVACDAIKNDRLAKDARAAIAKATGIPEPLPTASGLSANSRSDNPSEPSGDHHE